MQRLAIALFAATMLSTGCATIIKGSTAKVSIGTSPPGATVYVNGNPVGNSPLMVSLPHDDAQVRAELPGYQPGYASITTSFSGWSLLGGILIDAITGAITTIDNTNIFINLTPLAAPPAPPPVSGFGPAPGRPNT